MPTSPFSRRNFLKTAALASAPFILRWDLSGAPADSLTALHLGLCADPHKDITKDADLRMRTFIDEMKRTKPGFIFSTRRLLPAARKEPVVPEHPERIPRAALSHAG